MILKTILILTGTSLFFFSVIFIIAFIEQMMPAIKYANRRMRERTAIDKFHNKIKCNEAQYRGCDALDMAIKLRNSNV